MSPPPIVNIDPKSFWQDPYPVLAEMRAKTPICFVPELNANLMVRRDDIFTCEKNIAVFSSDQPGGLMTVLMGENMMRKDGEPHMRERKQCFPALSPRTVRDVWKTQFQRDTQQVLAKLAKQKECDLVTDYALPVSANALRHITGLTCLTPQQMDAASQGMIDGVGNYIGDPEIERRCHAATAMVDAAIDEMYPGMQAKPDTSLLGTLCQTDQPMESIRANIKLAISGGQNEPRDAIAGAIWALLTHRDQLERILKGEHTWLAAFEEYARWISPIGMSPRRIAQDFEWNDIDLKAEERLFFMFGSANRDEDMFENPDAFDISRDTSKAISFGAGPHFCAGAAASRCLISEVALPMLFDAFPEIELNGEVPFGGWAFRGPLEMPITLFK
ncbi:MAG: cytochrome P450 [Pseudomonadota bacterium]